MTVFGWSSKIEPVLSQISSLTFGASMLLPTKWLKGLDWYSCAADALDTVTGAEVLKSITSCVAAGASGSAGGLLNICATGPGFVFTQIEGAVRTAQGSYNEGFTVTLVAPDAVRELPGGAEWLFEYSTGGTSNSGTEDVANVPAAGTSLHAYPFSTNQWISCTSTLSTSTYAPGPRVGHSLARAGSAGARAIWPDCVHAGRRRLTSPLVG